MGSIIEFILVEVEAAFSYINISLSSSPFNDAECLHLGMLFVVPQTHTATQTVHDSCPLVGMHTHTHTCIFAK